MAFKSDWYINVSGYRVNNYYDTYILDSGQTIKIEFQESWTNSKRYYNIYLVIMNKKKSEHNTRYKIMGRDGLKSFIWAKNKIMEFESFIKEKYEGIPCVIYCRWDDNRRRDAYYSYLKKIGYQYGMIENKKAIYKIII